MRALLVITLLVASLAVLANGETMNLKSLLLKNQSELSEQEVKNVLNDIINFVTSNPAIINTGITLLGSLFGKRDLTMDDRKIQAIINHLVNYFSTHQTVFNQLLSIISGRSTMSEAELKGFWDSISNAVNNAVNAVGTAANNVGNAIGTAANNVGNALGTAANNVGNALGTAANAVGNFIEPALPGIISVITSPEVIQQVVPVVISIIGLAGKRDLSAQEQEKFIGDLIHQYVYLPVIVPAINWVTSALFSTGIMSTFGKRSSEMTAEELKDLFSGLGNNLLQTLINAVTNVIFQAIGGNRVVVEIMVRGWFQNVVNAVKPIVNVVAPVLVSTVLPAIVGK